MIFMKRFCLALFILIFASCNLPNQVVTPSPNDVATQVNQLLTTIPTETEVITQPTTQLVTRLPNPTATIMPTSTATPTTQPTSIASSTPTLQSTNTPQIVNTATVSTTDPRDLLGNPTRSNTMQNGGGFFAYSDEHVRFEPRADAMAMTAFNPDGWHGWALSDTVLDDAYLEMTVHSETCSGKDRYGLMLNAPDPNQGYFYSFSCDGRYSFRYWDGSEFITLIDWTANGSTLSGSNQTNRLGVQMEGDQFTFYANGVRIGEFRDDTFDAGKYGIFVASSATEDFTVLVEQIDYWDNP